MEDIRSHNNYSIRFASKNGHYKVIELLVEQGLTLENIRSHNNYSLRFASKNGHYKVLESSSVYQGLTEDEVKKSIKRRRKRSFI